jgi:tripartite-type tricarboxylate transporter receptor subunit TctC
MMQLPALLLLACAATGALAQPAPYPSKPIRIIVPTVARTPIDHATRIIARGFIEAWGQPVLVDNRAAGNGVAGQEMVANAQPDGHTLLMQSTAFVTLPLFYKLPYDTERDFIPVSRIASSGLVLVAHPSLTAGSVKELVALARRQPGVVSYASYGNGSITHFAGDVFGSIAAIELSHAAQRDVPQALGEVMSGRVQTMFLEIAYALPHVEAGALRALATTGRARSPLMPGLPTLAESGVSGYEIAMWFGAFAPAGTPAPIIERIATELARVLETPGTDRRMLEQGFEIAWLPAAEFQRFVRGESQRLAALVKKTGARRQWAVGSGQ